MFVKKLISPRLDPSANFLRCFSFKPLMCKLDPKDAEIRTAEVTSKRAQRLLKRLSDYAKAGGGPKAIHRHTNINKKLLVRDRLKLLLDPDSPFLEVGLLAGLFMDYGSVPTAGAIVGIGKIQDKFCIIAANDATVKGGAFFPISVRKHIRMQQLAYLNNLPCIYLVDSGGAFLPLQSEVFPDRNHGGRTFYNEAILSSMGIPQIAVVCGNSTAGGAYCPTMAEEAIIVKDSGIIFLGGPPLVKAATGEIVSEQDLGGAVMHCSVSGCTDYFAENEEEAFQMCRESVLTFDYSPNIKLEYKEPLYSADDLLILSGKKHLNKEDMYLILSRILDGSMFKEFKSKFGSNLIAGFGCLKGMLVGLLANCGQLTFQDAQKGAHFIQMCEKRNIPLCFLQNSGQTEEDNICTNDLDSEALKWRSKMVAAHSNCKVPKVTLCVHGCLADDNFTMCGAGFLPNIILSWPLAHVSSSRLLEHEVRSDLSKYEDVKTIEDYDTLFENKTTAFHHASQMLLDGLVNPENTREVLALSIEIALSSRRCEKFDKLARSLFI